MLSEPLLNLRTLNHVSKVCWDVNASRSFYRDILGFVEIKRPHFDFEGCWLFGMGGVGIHLIEGEPARPRSNHIDPRADHLSFTCESLQEVEERLQRLGIEFMRATVEEGGVRVSQLFIMDPGGSGMIEICNCDCLPIQPLLGPCRSRSQKLARLPSNAMSFSPENRPLKQPTELHRDSSSSSISSYHF